ncbi:hypothetical protein C5167_048493 [Papaver somniferum]|uniref:Low-temperature-induced 65 kDa protein n=1 Tax=Papaver somniferum TaxID=3469 RepID=A0A4Y7KI44_PAPSO|nr:low-temperature-induced 65 kDa protein-like [Papaver somniferum]RZC73013.1 hypothetical protein C5167_048493 [Papaver somniferum]
MNTQMVNPHSHTTYEQDQGIGGGLHSAGGHHEQDEHHEKKSVIKKVKAKAKKIKDTIGSKIHGGHEHEHEHDDQDLDEEDDSDDELEQDPEVHGAPIYESSAVMMGNENLNSGPTHLNVVDKGKTGPAGINFSEQGVPGPKRTDFGMKSNTGPSNLDLHDKANTGQSRNNLGMSRTGESKTGLGMHTPLETDPNAPFGSDTSGNYQSKVTDPTGGGAKEADVEPMIRSFGKMEFTNEPGEKPAFTGTGSHDQFSPDSTETKVDDMSVDTELNRNPSYTEKITGAASAIAGSAASALTGTAASAKNVVGSAASTITGTAATAKNAVASKLGCGGSDNSDIATQDTHLTHTEGTHTGSDQTKSTTAAVGDYGRKVSSTVSEKLAPVYGTVAGVGSAVVTPVYEKVAGAGSAVASKIQGTGSNTSARTGTGADAGTGTGGVGFVTEQDKGVSMKDYLVQKLSPGEEDKALSEVISGVMHKKKDEFPPTVAENMDRVTDSPQVARSLGTGEHEYQKDGGDQGYGNDGSSVASGGGIGSPSGKGMVDRVKGVVSSWFGKGTGDQIYADEQRSSGGGMGERKKESHGTGGTGVVH